MEGSMSTVAESDDTLSTVSLAQNGYIVDSLEDVGEGEQETRTSSGASARASEDSIPDGRQLETGEFIVDRLVAERKNKQVWQHLSAVLTNVCIMCMYVCTHK